MSNARTRLTDTGLSFLKPRNLRHALLGLAAALLAACGGGGANMSGNPQPSACSDCGTALLTMTDAAGDFMSYTVDVTSLQLKKANGAVVETLPATSRIDFAQLVDLSEVLSAGQVPTGEYVAATLNVDFSNADIVVDDGTGTGVQLNPVDASGQALGKVQLTVQLDNRHHLLINRKRVSRLAFDLDLAASNAVDLTAQTVTVSPVIVATVQPDASRQIRARGRLDSVDVTAGTYTIDVRPFHQDTDSTGQIVINTTDATRFEINGKVFTGTDGLTQLSMLTGNPVTIAFGTIDATDQSFTAQRVLAATSAEDLRRDYLSGNVIARSDNTLTVGGARLGRRNGHFGFKLGQVSVTVGPDTIVTRDGQSSGTLDSGAISVGQRVEIYGDFTDGSSDPASMDATAGLVRLNYTHLFGTIATPAMANPVAGQDLTLALTSIDGVDPKHFDFTGTGATAADDADAAHYVVHTNLMTLAPIQLGAYTRLYGFVTPFGTAPPDFTADTIVDFASARAGLGISWGHDGSTAPFSATSATGITVDLTTGLHGAVKLGGRFIDVATLATGLVIAPSTDGMPVFAIAHRSSHMVDNFSSFADFTAALNTGLDGTTAVLGLFGDGTFDSAGGTFTAQRLLVVLGD
jgi:hypothetical protein